MNRRAFTLIELLTALAIIAVLTGMILGGVGAARRSAERSAAKALVGTIVAAIRSYTLTSLSLYADGAVTSTVCQAWDADKDTLLDGQLDPPLFWARAPTTASIGGPVRREQLRYRGFAWTVAPPGLRGIRESDGMVLDPWQRPLHIAWAAAIYGDDGFCVWSEGRDPLARDDDISSRDLR